MFPLHYPSIDSERVFIQTNSYGFINYLDVEYSYISRGFKKYKKFGDNVVKALTAFN